MTTIQAKLISHDCDEIEMAVEITIGDDMIIVKAANGASISLGIDEDHITLLAWQNDDGKHDPDLVLPVPNLAEGPLYLDLLIDASRK